MSEVVYVAAGRMCALFGRLLFHQRYSILPMA
jgi:hypothetical protein